LKQPDPRILVAIAIDGNQCGLLHGVQRALATAGFRQLIEIKARE
jgi:hypothetical protein